MCCGTKLVVQVSFLTSNRTSTGLPINWVDDIWVRVADSLFGYLVFGVHSLFGLGWAEVGQRNGIENQS